MRRWDRLLDSYIEEYRARGVSPQSVAYTEARLHRWGRWLKGRRPRVGIERIDAEMITRYMANCSSFRAKATVYATLSSMRGFGDYLVRQGLWKINPLRWMKGPKVTPYSRLPKRIDHAHMEAMWREAANRHGAYTSHLWVTVLAMLYGTGLRRGELERLNLDAFDRTEGTLRIDGRKTGQERCVPLPEMVLRCLEAYLPLRGRGTFKGVGVNLANVARPGEFPLGSPESRTAARMQLAQWHDGRKRVQLVTNTCFAHPREGGLQQDPTRFGFSAWQECEGGSLLRTVYRPGSWLKPGDPIPTCPDCGALYEKEEEHAGIAFYHASCMNLHDPERVP